MIQPQRLARGFTSTAAKAVNHLRCGAALLLLATAGCAPQPARPPVAAAGPALAPAPAAPAPAPAKSTAAPLAAVPPGMSPQDIAAITAHHNRVRADVGVAPLKWSPGLASFAQQWVEELAISGCRMKHRSPNAYGENLFQGTFGAFTAVDAAKAWETEKQDYSGGVLTEANWAPAGHYTQMVWRQTTHLGCGQAICKNTLIVACNYDPAGNVMGRAPY